MRAEVEQRAAPVRERSLPFDSKNRSLTVAARHPFCTTNPPRFPHVTHYAKRTHRGSHASPIMQNEPTELPASTVGLGKVWPGKTAWRQRATRTQLRAGQYPGPRQRYTFER